jgi:hypothetical protein
VNISNDQSTYLDVALVPENSCNVIAGTISTSSQLSNLCAGDNSPDVIEVDVIGNSGFAGIFGIVDENNNVMGASQSGSFNVNGLPSGIYRIKHMTYAEGVNPSVSNASELEGCYALSNSIFFSVSRVEGGVIFANQSTQLCGDDGIPSVLDVNLSGEEGANSRWVVLNAGFTQVLASANEPDFNFDAFGIGTYRVVHVSYANGVNLGQVDPQDVQGCLDVSNILTVNVENCNSNFGDLISGADASVTFSPQTSGAYFMELIDLNGRVVEVLYDGDLSANEEVRIRWNTDRLPAGIYLLRAVGAGTSEVKKIMIE